MMIMMRKDLMYLLSFPHYSITLAVLYYINALTCSLTASECPGWISLTAECKFCVRLSLSLNFLLVIPFSKSVLITVAVSGCMSQSKLVLYLTDQ